MHDFSSPGRRLAAVLTVTAVALMAVGCGGDDTEEEPATAASGTTKLRVLASPHANVAPLYIADKKGYFADEGIEVDISPPASPAAAFPALATGDIDVMYASITSGASAIANGQDFKLMLQQSNGRPNTVGIVTDDQSIQGGADLAGKKIAGVQISGGTCDMGAKAVLQEEGVDPSKLKWVELPRETQGAAMERGDVDAICAVEPMITQLEHELGARLVVDSLTGPFDRMPADGYFVRSDFAEDQKEVIDGFRSAIERAVADAKSDEQELRATIEEFSGMPPAIVEDMALSEYVAAVEPSEIQRVLDAMQEAGVLRAPLRAEDIIVPSS